MGDSIRDLTCEVAGVAPPIDMHTKDPASMLAPNCLLGLLSPGRTAREVGNDQRVWSSGHGCGSCAAPGWLHVSHDQLGDAHYFTTSGGVVSKAVTQLRISHPRDIVGSTEDHAGRTEDHAGRPRYNARRSGHDSRGACHDPPGACHDPPGPCHDPDFGSEQRWNLLHQDELGQVLPGRRVLP